MIGSRVSKVKAAAALRCRSGGLPASLFLLNQAVHVALGPGEILVHPGAPVRLRLSSDGGCLLAVEVKPYRYAIGIFAA
jgi:hypothetical protein